MLQIQQITLLALALQGVATGSPSPADALGDPAGLARLGGSEGPDMTRYLLVCSGILLAVAALAFGFRRLVGRNLTAKAAKRSLQIMDVLPMGGRKRLAVVRCYDRTFLLGMGEKELSLVAELDPVIEPQEAPLPAASDRRAFADLLERVQPQPATSTSSATVERKLPTRSKPPAGPLPARQPVRPVRLPDANLTTQPARSAAEGGAGWLG